jgi:hypothetical protein
MNIAVRCCGKTQITTSMRQFLKSLSKEIDDMYGTVGDSSICAPVPNDLQSLKNSFAERLAKATIQQPLLVIIDGIEEMKGRLNVINQ